MHHGKTNKTNEHPKHSLKKMVTVKQARRARACATRVRLEPHTARPREVFPRAQGVQS